MAWALAAWTNLFPVPEHSGGVGLAPESLKGASPERLPNKQKVGKSFITAGARPANFAIASSTLSRSLGGHSSTVLQKITTVSLPTALTRWLSSVRQWKSAPQGTWKGSRRQSRS